ncbi:MAG: hypothetical protein IT287_03005 [Bdellovibrionaceae bacterium]|nr:hypothetical protein [Pseudobdellovibrionaceae bacterium]
MLFKEKSVIVFIVLFVFGSFAEAGTVKRVEGKRVVIQLEPEEEIVKYDYYYLMSASGKRRGLILISEVVDDEAWGSISKGIAEEGWTLKYRGPKNPQEKSPLKDDSQETATKIEPAATMDADSDEVDEPERKSLYYHETVYMELDFVGAATGQFTPRFEYRIGSSFALGAVLRFASYDFSPYEFSQLGYGLSARYFFSDFRSSGFYVAADYQRVQERIELDTGSSLRVSEDGSIMSARLGYRWMFDKGWSFSLGYFHGFSSFNEEERLENLPVLRDKYYGDYSFGELTLGYTF